jgi:Hypothetical protein (DUF2513)
VKRDLDLIRDILLDIEENVRLNPDEYGYSFDHPDQEAVAYALYLMVDHRLISADHCQASGLPHGIYADIKITWSGTEFLDSVRDGEIWKKTKQGVKEAGGFTFDLLKALAKGLVKKKIEDHTGVVLDL